MHNACGKNPKFKSKDALQRTNKQVRDIANKLELTDDEVEVLHELITGQGYGYKEIMEIAKTWFK